MSSSHKSAIDICSGLTKRTRSGKKKATKSRTGAVTILGCIIVSVERGKVNFSQVEIKHCH